MESNHPNFKENEMKIGVECGEVYIYATTKGLEKLVTLCKELIDNPNIGHIHLEDYNLTTRDSMRCAIAIFDR